MNISTRYLNINDINGAEKYSTMDKESLQSYIGKVILELELQKDAISIKETLISVIYEILKHKDNIKEKDINFLSKNLAGGIIDELEKYVSISHLTKEDIELIIEPFIDKIAFIMDEDLKTISESSIYQKLFSIGLVNDAIVDEDFFISNDVARKKLESLPQNILTILRNIKKIFFLKKKILWIK